MGANKKVVEELCLGKAAQAAAMHYFKKIYD